MSGLWVTQTGWRPELRSRHTIVTCKDGDVAAIGDRAEIEKHLAASGRTPSELSREEIAATLMKAGIPNAPVRTIDEVGRSEQKSGGFIRLVNAGKSRWPLLELPFRLSRMPDYDLRPIGVLGAANSEFNRSG